MLASVAIPGPALMLCRFRKNKFVESVAFLYNRFVRIKAGENPA